MKKMMFAAMMAVLASCATAQDTKDIQLLAPNKDKGASIMKSLAQRQSHRKCADKELSTADLSDLLWAANGINRPGDNKRTAPSALNRQDIDVYVISKTGAYKYIAAENRLQLITEGDHRDAVASGQDFVNQFPVSLVLVSELSKLGDAKNERTRMTAAMDAGYVSQNICLFCAGNGLVTVPRATMNSTELKKILKLGDTALPLLNNPVGYPKGK